MTHLDVEFSVPVLITRHVDTTQQYRSSAEDIRDLNRTPRERPASSHFPFNRPGLKVAQLPFFGHQRREVVTVLPIDVAFDGKRGTRVHWPPRREFGQHRVAIDPYSRESCIRFFIPIVIRRVHDPDIRIDVRAQDGLTDGNLAVVSGDPVMMVPAHEPWGNNAYIRRQSYV